MLKKFVSWLKFNLLYFGKPRWDTRISPPELLAFLKKFPPGKALDLGCGTGTNLLTLAQAGWDVTGVDFAPKAVFEARKRFKQSGLKGNFLVGDVTKLSGVWGPFNLVFDMGCFHNLDESGKKAYIDLLKKVMEHKGHFLLYAHCKHPGSNLDHGIVEGDLENLGRYLMLVNRQDGEERGGPSVWVLYQNQE